MGRGAVYLLSKNTKHHRVPASETTCIYGETAAFCTPKGGHIEAHYPQPPRASPTINCFNAFSCIKEMEAAGVLTLQATSQFLVLLTPWKPL